MKIKINLIYGWQLRPFTLCQEAKQQYWLFQYCDSIFYEMFRLPRRTICVCDYQIVLAFPTDIQEIKETNYYYK